MILLLIIVLKATQTKISQKLGLLSYANACCKTYTPLSCDTQGHAMSILEERKNDKYLMAYKNVGVEFKPLAMPYIRHLQKVFQETSYRSE
jgi:hypothetical protein